MCFPRERDAMDNPFIYILLPLAGYLAGSIPFGMIIGRLNGVDLRTVGSGNTGATNVTRVLGKAWGYSCFLLDVAKGFGPVFATGLMVHGMRQVPTLPQQALWLAVGVGCILGHVFSFWLKFRGGKGVATALGVVLGIYPYFTFVGLVAFALWILVTLASRYVSVGSIVAAVGFLVLFAAFYFRRLAELWPLGAFAAAMMALIIVRHRGNIQRLRAGTENKIGRKKTVS